MKSAFHVVCAVVFVFLLFPGLSRAQSENQIDSLLNPVFPSSFAYHGAGARALGMGYAFLATSNDITSLTWNPAGLLGVEKPTLGLEYRVVGGGNEILSSQSNITLNDNLSALHFLSYGMQIRIRNHPFGVGLSIDRPVQEVRDIQFKRVSIKDNSLSDNIPNADSTFSTTTSLSRDNILRVIVGFGTRLSGPLSFGASLAFYDGKGSHTNTNNFELRSYLDSTNQIGSGQLVTLNPSLGVSDTVSYSGTSLQIGFRYDKESIRLAATFRPKHKMRFTYDYILSNTASFNGTPLNSGGVIFRDDQVSDLEIPSMIALGGSFDATQDLALAADFESRAFGNSTYNRRTELQILTGDDIEVFETTDPNYQNAISFRLGGEYWLNRLTDKNPGIALRAGYFFEDMAGPEFQFDTTTGVQTISKFSANSFSVGAGVWWTQIHLDAGVSFTSSSENQTVATFELNSAGITTGVPPIIFVPVEVKSSYPTFRLTFTGVF